MAAPSSPRRSPNAEAANRTALLDAAELLMLEEGYAAVTARRLAARAGLKPQLVHYYFGSMDDLFLNVLRRGSERNLVRLQRAVASPQPLRAIWALSNEPKAAALHTEMVALGNHRKAVRVEMAAQATRFRQVQIDALSDVIGRYDHLDTDLFPATTITVLIASVSRVLGMEQAMGMDIGHADTNRLVEHLLDVLEGPAP